jgi:hypothetical protein
LIQIEDNILRKNIFLLIFVPLLLYSLQAPYTIQQDNEYDIVKEANPLFVQEDFSESPDSNWILSDAAYWNSDEENIVLTEPGSQLVGVIWLKDEINSPFTADFRYKAGGGSGADGFVFMFFKDWDYKPGIGGFLGFHCRAVNEPCPRTDAPGYGLEFDNYYNSKAEYGEVYGEGDPSPNHIALIKDFIGNHLIHENDSRTEDNIWHQVKVTVQPEEITVWIDGEQLLSYLDNIDRTHGHMGFGSGIWGYDHQHIIDDFRLYGNTISVKGLQLGWTVELISENGLVDEIQVANSSGEVFFDVADLDFPIEGKFRVLQESKLIFESSTSNDLWGGDIWTLSIRNSEQSSPQSSDSIINLETVAVTIGISAIIFLLAFLFLLRRKKKRE